MATKIKKSAMTNNYNIVWSDDENADAYKIMSYIYDSGGTITDIAPGKSNLFVTCGEKIFISGYWKEEDTVPSWLELNKYNGLTILSDNFEPLIQCTYRFTFNGFLTSSSSSVYAPHTCLWEASFKYGDEEISSITPQQINGSFSHSFAGYKSQMPSKVTFTANGYYQPIIIDLVSTDFTENDSYMDCTINVRNALALKDTNQQFTISLKDSSGTPTTGSVYIMDSSGRTLASSASNSSHTIRVNNITVDKYGHPAKAKVIWDNGDEEVFDLNITTPNDISLTFYQPEEYDYFSFNGSITFEGNSINDNYAHLSITPVIMFKTGAQDDSISDYMIEINLPEFNLSGIDYNPDWDLDSSYLDIELVYNNNTYQKRLNFGEATDESNGKDAIYNFGEIDFTSDDWV